MKIVRLEVANYKGLRDVSVPTSPFVCIIGHNNAGKSSLLQSVLLFLEGRKLSPAHFYDPGCDIVVRVKIEAIGDRDLELVINAEHRERIRAGLNDGSITLVRRYATDGNSRLRWIIMAPKDDRFGPDQIEALVKGKRPGQVFEDEILRAFPELADKVNAKTNQSQVKELIADLARSLPAEDKIAQESDLPTGYDASFKAFLPEPIYIPAVKDFSDDIKTKESASFGKLIGILLNAIAPELAVAEDAFKSLNKKLNLVADPDGRSSDERLPAVRLIEATVRSFVRESFPSVDLELQIPPPELKTVLSSARVIVNDGVKGELDSKGDGLKRSVAFAILRSIATLKRHPELNPPAMKPNPGFLLLFEEPELYLHPTAQRVLFDALRVISQTDQVLVSTHSPLFFSASSTGTFIKVVKESSRGDQTRPFARTIPVDLSTVDKKSKFQIISYEINNSAFFSRTIILVEGDSDHLVFPHMARILNEDWCVDRNGVSICRLRGKGNIGRYRSFFSAFGVRVIVLADLDCLLDGFDQLGVVAECAAKRRVLIQALDSLIRAEADVSGGDGEYGELLSDTEAFAKLSERNPVSQKVVKDAFMSVLKKTQWDDLIHTWARLVNKSATIEEVRRVGELFFDRAITKNRRYILERTDNLQVQKLKHDLLIALRECDVYLLSRGTLEMYLPEGIDGDKPTRALKFCDAIKSRDEVLSLCDDVPASTDGINRNELELVFSRIFDGGLRGDEEVVNTSLE